MDLENSNPFTRQPSSYDITQELRFLQKKIISPSIPASDAKLITLKSRGVNSKYSVLSFRNTYAESYLFNLKLNNTIGTADQVTYTDYDFPEMSNVIIYWPLKNNTKPQIVNTDYLSEELNFTFNSQAVIFGTNSLSNDKSIKSLILNTKQAQDAQLVANNLPGYLWLDDRENNIKLSSNAIKSILYNKTGKTPQTTLIVWAFQSVEDAGNNPFLSDFNYQTKEGLYISHEVI